MTRDERQQLLELFWPENRASTRGVWAIVDCARDPQIYEALVQSRLDFRCLYSGNLPQALERVAPHLVQLQPGNRLVRRLLDEGWGRAWGVFLKIDDPSNLRHHLRKFLRVRDEDGRKLIFRYYDPRVLRLYLPSCTFDELETVFGPIAAFYVEGEAETDVIEFAFNGVRLTQRTLDMRRGVRP